MRAQSSYVPAIDSVEVEAWPNMMDNSRVDLIFREKGYLVRIQLTKQKAGELKNALAALDLES